MPRPERERGAALLTVLLLVAIIAVLAATALEKLRLSTTLAANAAAIDQARAYALAAEVLATTRVTDIVARAPDVMSLADGWSDRPFALPVPGGVATARVVDGANCFNLNGLVEQTGPDTYAQNPAQTAQFARLLRLAGVPGRLPDTIAAAATDWIDTDAVPLAGGAEDGVYAARPVPYRAANAPMADASELRAVDGVTPEIWDRVRRWVCTLPVTTPSVVNVNTLTPEQAPVLAMLLPDGLGIDAARAMLLRRAPQGYKTVDAFWAAPALAGQVASGEAKAQTAVVTRWFALKVDVALGRAEIHERALIDARKAPARLVSRSWGEGA